MSDSSTIGRNKAVEVGNSFNAVVADATENVKSAAGYVADQAKEIASNASKGLNKAGTYLDDKAEDATVALGGRLKAAGDIIRQNVPHEGRIGEASSTVAQSLTDTGEYLQREGLEGIVKDLADVIKRNPIPSVLIGVGIGLLVARATRAGR